MEKLSKQQKFENIFKKASSSLKNSDCFGPPIYAPPPQLSVFSTNISENKTKEKNSRLFFIENHLEKNIFDQKHIEKIERAKSMKNCYLSTFSANKKNVFDSKQLGKNLSNNFISFMIIFIF